MILLWCHYHSVSRRYRHMIYKRLYLYPEVVKIVKNPVKSGSVNYKTTSESNLATKYLLLGLYRNSLLIPSLTLWKLSGITDRLFTVESVYDLIWFSLRHHIHYCFWILPSTWKTNKNKIMLKWRLISLKCSEPTKQSYKSSKVSRKNNKWTIYTTVTSNDFKVPLRMPGCKRQVSKSIKQISSS